MVATLFSPALVRSASPDFPVHRIVHLQSNRHDHCLTHGSDTSTRQVKLLVSIRDASEAEVARSAGVDWIDLKEPSQGPLGAADFATVDQVASALRSHPRRSAALGELRGLEACQVDHFAEAFPILKVGLSGMQARDWRRALQRLRLQLLRANSQLVPVIYADWSDCGAPSPEQIVAFCEPTSGASQADWPLVLIDTHAKQGASLLDHWTDSELAQVVGQLSAYGTRVVLAGSLSAQAVVDLIGRQLPIEAVGVRGAVCESGREGPICAALVKALAQAVHEKQKWLTGSGGTA